MTNFAGDEGHHAEQDREDDDDDQVVGRQLRVYTTASRITVGLVRIDETPRP